MGAVPDNLERRVIEIIAKRKHLDPATLTSATTFEQLGIDSLDAADLLFAFEDDFGIVVPDDVARSMRSVGQVVEGLRGLNAGAAGAP
jgi:acyl carrier protein